MPDIVEDIYEAYSGALSASEQPTHGPRQITAPDQLVPGMRVRGHYKNGMTVDFEVLESPNAGDGTFQARNDQGRVSQEDFSAFALVPYPSGRWHATNWLEQLPDTSTEPRGRLKKFLQRITRAQ